MAQKHQIQTKRTSDSLKLTENKQKRFSQLIFNKPNTLTCMRLMLNFIAASIFDKFTHFSALLIFISVILDYFDGMVARKYNECSFFGEVFDWMADFSAYTIVLFKLIELDPDLKVIYILLFHLQLLTMITDIISKVCKYGPKITVDHWCTYMLKYTMDDKRRGYSSVGFFGYWNELIHFACLLSGILYISTSSYFWLSIVWMSLFGSISYVWMHLGYTYLLLNSWSQYENDGQSKVQFIEK